LCFEVLELEVYLLVPRTSNHPFNFECDSNVTLLRELEAQWCVLVRVDPIQVHILREGGWGRIETLDLKTP